jgi:gamma-glutamyltranspeptidase / glutathione hydrolase
MRRRPVRSLFVVLVVGVVVLASQAIADPRLSQRNTSTTQVEPVFLTTLEATALSALGHVFSTTPEIGAATGIEFLGGGQLLAAAEPVRRGGSAMVVSPSP